MRTFPIPSPLLELNLHRPPNLLDVIPITRTASLQLRNLEQPRLLLMRGRIAKHQIHVLEWLAARLQNEELGEAQRQQAEDGEEDVRASLDHAQHVQRDESDYKVADPCRAGRNEHGFGAVAKVEDLRGKHPPDGREGVGEVDTIDVDEGNPDPTGGFVVDEGVAIRADNGADDEERHEGAEGSAHEKGASADLVDQEEG